MKNPYISSSNNRIKYPFFVTHPQKEKTRNLRSCHKQNKT